MSKDFHLEGKAGEPLDTEENVQKLAEWLRDLMEGEPDEHDARDT